MGPGGFDSLNLKNAKNSRDTATLTNLKRKYQCNTLKSYLYCFTARMKDITIYTQ